MDIPPVSQPNQTPPVNADQTSYDYQRTACINALTNLPKDRSTATVNFNANVCYQVVRDLEEKGYNVRYTTTYNSSEKKTVTQLKIINPATKDPFSELFDCFEGHVHYNDNEVKDNMKNLFVKFFSQ